MNINCIHYKINNMKYFYQILFAFNKLKIMSEIAQDN